LEKSSTLRTTNSRREPATRKPSPPASIRPMRLRLYAAVHCATNRALPHLRANPKLEPLPRESRAAARASQGTLHLSFPEKNCMSDGGIQPAMRSGWLTRVDEKICAATGGVVDVWSMKPLYKKNTTTDLMELAVHLRNHSIFMVATCQPSTIRRMIS
jgi:hypothetical protein